MFKKYYNKFQEQHFANTWQHMLKHKEMIRNNFHSTGDIKKAKVFVNNFHIYNPHEHFASHGEHVIFTNNALTCQLNPAYAIGES